jgi:hypothetical protein
MTPSRPRAAVNVDIDGLYLYDRIHGHAGGSGNAVGFDPATHDPTVWTRGIPRFLDAFGQAGIQATFFVVAQDLAHADVRAVLKDCVAAGHEIGSHSFTHPYNLSRLPPDAMGEELVRARHTLQDATGQAVLGFRAPGYVLSDALRTAIADAGHTWDSSRFPCPPYQLAKATFIQAYRLLGRPSGSLIEPVGVWVGPRKPYRDRLPDGRTLVELPVGVLPGMRVPFIGTSVLMWGEAGRKVLAPVIARSDWMNFECHAIDLTDHAGDGIPDRLKTQPDQRVPLAKKGPLFQKVLSDLAHTHDVRTLGAWAATL